MKWDVKHDRAKKVLNHFLDNAGYWTETESLTEGLTEDEIQEVSAEVATMIQSITKRYKLDVVLPAEPVVKEEPAAEEKVEEQVAENLQKRSRKKSRSKSRRDVAESRRKRRLRRMAYERKTIDTWELQLNYGYGWEYTLTEFTREEARARLKEYRENQPQYPARLVKKRVRKEEVA